MSEQWRSSRPKRTTRSQYDNIGSALLALFLAIVVWVVATYNSDPPLVDYVSLPIDRLNKPAGMKIVDSVDDRVRVQIKAPKSTWDHLEDANLHAYVDLANAKPGVNKLEVQVTWADKYYIRLLKKEPKTIIIRLERILSKDVPVHVNVPDLDAIPLGYIAYPPSVSPVTVTITGPESLVSQVTEARVDIWIQEARETMERRVMPTLRDADGEEVTGLTVSPSIVTVRVPIERQLGFGEVTVRAVLTGTPASGYWVSNVTVKPSTVTVYGKREVIENMPGLAETAPVDIEGADQTVTKRVPLTLPEGVSVFSKDPSGQTVVVTVEIQAIMGGQTVRRKVEILGLYSGYQARVSPEEVDVILSGPLPQLQAITADDVQVFVNLLGLRSGTYMLTPVVILPEETQLRVQSIQPETVEVTIEYPTPERSPSPSVTPTITGTVTIGPQITVTPGVTVTLTASPPQTEKTSTPRQ